MKRALAAGILLAALILPAAGNNLDPTIVTVNGDGTITVTTTATSRYCDQEWRQNAYFGCNVRITWPGATSAYGTEDDQAVTIPINPFWGCPCTAQFWEHGGQYHPYSAVSEPFTP